VQVVGDGDGVFVVVIFWVLEGLIGDTL